MPYSTAAKNLMLAALKGTNPTTPITHVGAQTKGADVTSGVTATASTDKINKTAHGLSNGQVVTFSGLTGGAGLVAGRLYFVINVTTNDFQVSTVLGGTVTDITTDASVVTYNVWTEMSGGSYARQAIAYNTPGEGTMDDSTNGAAIAIPAGGNVDGVSYHSASTAGTLLGLDPKTREAFAGAGNYNVSDSDLDLNAVG